MLGEKIDEGKIISQKKIKILNNDTAETLYKKFTISSFLEFKKFFSKLINKKKIIYYESKKSNTKYKNKHFPNNGNINWKWNGKKIYNFFRSMIHEPFSPPKILIGSKPFYIVSRKMMNTKRILKSPK